MQIADHKTPSFLFEKRMEAAKVILLRSVKLFLQLTYCLQIRNMIC